MFRPSDVRRYVTEQPTIFATCLLLRISKVILKMTAQAYWRGILRPGSALLVIYAVSALNKLAIRMIRRRAGRRTGMGDHPRNLLFGLQERLNGRLGSGHSALPSFPWSRVALPALPRVRCRRLHRALFPVTAPLTAIDISFQRERWASAP
jgi:hypothetical protein